jgi:hypothetical protein
MLTTKVYKQLLIKQFNKKEEVKQLLVVTHVTTAHHAKEQPVTVTCY